MAPTGAEQRDGHDGATEDKEPACDVVTDDDTDDDVEDENEEDVEEVPPPLVDEEVLAEGLRRREGRRAM